MLAAAAAIALLLLVGGLWLKLHYPGSNGIASGPPPTTGPVNPTGGGSAGVVAVNPPNEPVNPPAPQNAVPTRFAPQRKQLVAVKYRVSQKEREQREEQYIRRGEVAKEQLIKALLITSEKLNVVQKKIQGAHESSPIS